MYLTLSLLRKCSVILTTFSEKLVICEFKRKTVLEDTNYAFLNHFAKSVHPRC